MNRSTRLWLHRSPLFLAGGILLLILLPGGPNSAVAVKQVSPAATPATAPSRQPPTVLPAPVPVLQSASIDDRTSLVSASAPSRPSLGGASAWWAHYRIAAPAVATSIPTAATDGRVGAQAVNVRSGPAGDASKLFVLAAGEQVKLGETSSGWVHVYRPSGESGWVYGRYLAGQPTARDGQSLTGDVAVNSPPKIVNPAKNLAVVEFPMAVLAEPDDYAALLVVLRPGERVRFGETRGPWIRVVTEAGISGWVPS